MLLWLLPTLEIEGNAKFMVEVTENKDLIPPPFINFHGAPHEIFRLLPVS
jgi:hypothetical protein